MTDDNNKEKSSRNISDENPPKKSLKNWSVSNISFDVIFLILLIAAYIGIYIAVSDDQPFKAIAYIIITLFLLKFIVLKHFGKFVFGAALITSYLYLIFSITTKGLLQYITNVIKWTVDLVTTGYSVPFPKYDTLLTSSSEQIFAIVIIVISTCIFVVMLRTIFDQEKSGETLFTFTIPICASLVFFVIALNISPSPASWSLRPCETSNINELCKEWSGKYCKEYKCSIQNTTYTDNEHILKPRKFQNIEIGKSLRVYAELQVESNNKQISCNINAKFKDGSNKILDYKDAVKKNVCSNSSMVKFQSKNGWISKSDTVEVGISINGCPNGCRVKGPAILTITTEI